MKLNVKETAVFGVLGAVMYSSKMIMEVLPNIHLLGVFTIAITVVYRKKALYPIYLYVFLNGLLSGFAFWWIAYLYIWTLLWGVVMLLPQNLPKKAKPLIYMTICGIHGFMFGILYAPAQALIFGLDIKGTVAWILAGIPFDLIHGVSNFLCGMLICPVIALLKRVKNQTV